MRTTLRLEIRSGSNSTIRPLRSDNTWRFLFERTPQQCVELEITDEQLATHTVKDLIASLCRTHFYNLEPKCVQLYSSRGIVLPNGMSAAIMCDMKTCLRIRINDDAHIPLLITSYLVCEGFFSD